MQKLLETSHEIQKFENEKFKQLNKKLTYKLFESNNSIAVYFDELKKNTAQIRVYLTTIGKLGIFFYAKHFIFHPKLDYKNKHTNYKSTPKNKITFKSVYNVI